MMQSVETHDSLTEVFDPTHSDPVEDYLAETNCKIRIWAPISVYNQKLHSGSSISIPTWPDYDSKRHEYDPQKARKRMIHHFVIDKSIWEEEEKLRIPERFIMVKSLGNWIRNIESDQRTEAENVLLVICTDFEEQFLQYLDFSENHIAEKKESKTYYDNKDKLSDMRFDLKVKYLLTSHLEDYLQIITRIQEFTVEGFTEDLNLTFYKIGTWFHNSIEALTRNSKSRAARCSAIIESVGVQETLSEIELFVDERRREVNFITTIQTCQKYIVEPLEKLRNGNNALTAFRGRHDDLRMMKKDEDGNSIGSRIIQDLLENGHLEEASQYQTLLNELELALNRVEA